MVETTRVGYPKETKGKEIEKTEKGRESCCQDWGDERIVGHSPRCRRLAQERPMPSFNFR